MKSFTSKLFSPLLTVCFILGCAMPAQAQVTDALQGLQENLRGVAEETTANSSTALENDPDQDSDRDGIINSEDICMFIPEDIDGVDDEDGCPEHPEPAFSQPAPVQLEPMPCEEAPCEITIEEQADIIPFLDCLFGILTNQEGTIAYSQGRYVCIE